MTTRPRVAHENTVADTAYSRSLAVGKGCECDHVKAACSFIRENYSLDITVQDIAAKVAIDMTYLYRLFCRHMGISSSKYLRCVRLESALSLMHESGMSIKDASKATGFKDLSHFYRVFKSEYGVYPKQYLSGTNIGKSSNI